MTARQIYKREDRHSRAKEVELPDASCVVIALMWAVATSLTSTTEKFSFGRNIILRSIRVLITWNDTSHMSPGEG